MMLLWRSWRTAAQCGRWTRQTCQTLSCSCSEWAATMCTTQAAMVQLQRRHQDVWWRSTAQCGEGPRASWSTTRCLCAPTSMTRTARTRDARRSDSSCTRRGTTMTVAWTQATVEAIVVCATCSCSAATCTPTSCTRTGCTRRTHTSSRSDVGGGMTRRAQQLSPRTCCFATSSTCPMRRFGRTGASCWSSSTCSRWQSPSTGCTQTCRTMQRSGSGT
mmetsp:Transcript_3515/g.12140  ORF Transcript_3515/g.12140 Transcript_3515/m.12140 type:complete len:218 (+) Transcript_3515:398-1051(+)